MQLKILIVRSVIGVLGVMRGAQAVPIQAIFTGDTCDCPKKLNYLVNMPQPSMREDYTPSEYGYNLEWPLPSKAQVTYSFDFMVEEPKTPPPPPQGAKLDLFAKVDRLTVRKQDCYASQESAKACGCHQCGSSNRYVTPESSSTRFTRNLETSNGAEQTSQSSPQIVAIFLQRLKQTKGDTPKSRSRRDLARKNQKRSDRLIKQYNKDLKNLANEKTYFDGPRKTIRYKTAATPIPAGILPLQQLGNFLNLHRFRKKRDIKGEYELIEKEREQMDLTLPEIIQYMPETLDPNFKRNQCQFGKSCQQHQLPEATTAATIIPTTEEINTTTAATEKIGSTQDDLSATESNNSKANDQEQQLHNSKSLTHTKRNSQHYSTGCPIVFKYQNPTPKPSFIYEPQNNLEPLPQSYETANTLQGLDLVARPYTPSSPAIYVNRSNQPISNYELDRIIAAIVNKHADFVQASSHPSGLQVEPSYIQREQAKYFLKSLKTVPWNDWLGEYRH